MNIDRLLLTDYITCLSRFGPFPPLVCWGINDQDVDELPYLSRPPTTEWWWLWVKSFQRFLWSLCGQAIFWGSAMVRNCPISNTVKRRHLEPSCQCWSVLDHRLWMVMTPAGGVIVISSDVSFCGASFPTDKQKWKVSILVSGRVMTPMAPSNANNDGCKLGRFNGGTCIEMGAGLISPKLVWWLYTNYSIYIYYTCDVYIYSVLYVIDTNMYIFMYTHDICTECTHMYCMCLYFRLAMVPHIHSSNPTDCNMICPRKSLQIQHVP